MAGERNEHSAHASRKRTAWYVMPMLALLLAGCGTSMSSLNIFDSGKATQEPAAGDNAGLVDNADIECPSVAVRTGAATLMIAGDDRKAESQALNLRYQGSIVRTARECHVNAGVMTMKVGVEGRVITGPAGGPGRVDVPLRIAVVQEGVTPKAITSKFTIVPVEITSAIDRVQFTHVESDITFPLPVPGSLLDNYVVYVGFDTLTAQQQQRKPAPRSRRP